MGSKCISSRDRYGARNIHFRWALKGRLQLLAREVTASASSAATQRGSFGAGQLYSRRIIGYESAVNGWGLATMDISNALIQGITYAELAELIGEPLREVLEF